MSASLKPWAPVHALALPDVTINACTRLRCKWSLSMATDADTTLFVVNTPPAPQERVEWITQRSSFWSVGIAEAPAVNALIPHAAVPARKPRGYVRAIALDLRAR